MERFKNYLLLVMMALLLGMAGYVLYQQRKHIGEVTALQNSLAEKDKTIEIKEGLYHKLTLQNRDLMAFLDKKDKQVASLADELKKKKQELLTTTSLVISLKKEIELLADGTQTEVPSEDGKPSRTKVEFRHDFGFVKVDGWTLTNPPQSWVKLSPGKPLKLSLSIAQDKTGAWHSYATSNDPLVGVDISLTAVNPYLFKPKWYEGFGLLIGLGMGTNQSGLGALVQVGLTYKIKQFTVGPAVWLGLNNVVDKYYGVTFEWRPFEKIR